MRALILSLLLMGGLAVAEEVKTDGQPQLPAPFYRVTAVVDCTTTGPVKNCTVVVAQALGQVGEAQLLSEKVAKEGFWSPNSATNTNVVGTYYAPAAVRRVFVQQIYY